MAIVAMALLWTGSQIPVYLFGMIVVYRSVPRTNVILGGCPPYIYGDVGLDCLEQTLDTNSLIDRRNRSMGMVCVSKSLSSGSHLSVRGQSIRPIRQKICSYDGW
jgi:hypothetical protein